MKSEHILQVEIGGEYGKVVFRIFDPGQWFTEEVARINRLRHSVAQIENNHYLNNWLKSWMCWPVKTMESNSSHRMREYLLDYINCSGSPDNCVAVLKQGRFVNASSKDAKEIERLLFFTDCPILLSVSTAVALTAPSGIHLTQAAI